MGGGGGGPTKMVIHQDGDTFTGTLELPFGEGKIQQGKIKDNEITFVVQIETPRGDFEMQYTGKVEGDSMAGTWTGVRGGRGGGGGGGGGGEFTREWTAKRVET